MVRKGKFKKSKAFKGKCFSCGKIGHKSSDCRFKKKKFGGDSSNYEEKKRNGGKDKSSQKKRSESPTLLVIDTCLVRKDDAIWYLDSEATRHVTPHKDWFINYNLLPKDNPYLLKMILNVKLRELALFQYCSIMEFSRKLPMFSIYQEWQRIFYQPKNLKG